MGLRINKVEIKCSLLPCVTPGKESLHKRDTGESCKQVRVSGASLTEVEMTCNFVLCITLGSILFGNHFYRVLSIIPPSSTHLSTSHNRESIFSINIFIRFLVSLSLLSLSYSHIFFTFVSSSSSHSYLSSLLYLFFSLFPPLIDLSSFLHLLFFVFSISSLIHRCTRGKQVTCIQVMT